jgi:hypothetical protein
MLQENYGLRDAVRRATAGAAIFKQKKEQVHQ